MFHNTPSQGAPNGMMLHPGAYIASGQSQPVYERPQIYTAVYSGVSVYEMEVHGVAVMRRRSDSWLNATQILKVAGVDKGKRTKVLEKEILNGEHEKVQGGYGKYQGTWINYNRGREFCRQYLVEDLLRPLLDYDMGADGVSVAGQGVDTPTKEQAMAANRKRFYGTGLDGRGSQHSSGTFFQNISPTTSVALAAMNKAARLNSPAPRTGSAQRGAGNVVRRTSQQTGSQEHHLDRQQSMHSLASENSFGANGHSDSTYGTQNAQIRAGVADMGQSSMQEPPRKKMRPSSQNSFAQPMPTSGFDASMRSTTPTEPNDSFLYQQASAAHHHLTSSSGESGLLALPPLPAPIDKLQEEKQAAMLDLFADPSRTDFSTTPAIMHLSGADLDIPLDHSANTALHWAATLGRVPLMRLLISKGANIFRGNAAGQTPLMAAVQVNNCLDHGCFPELLEILGPLIEVRDAQGRTILHHIAVSCGIKGRAPSSKYYLEALLEFLVRSASISSSQQSVENGASSLASAFNRPIGLYRFMSEMVNVRDKAGNTALNLVARIGNRNIIQQLLEVKADPTIPNFRGSRPLDFGVGTDGEGIYSGVASHISSPSKSMAISAQAGAGSRIGNLCRDLVSTLETGLAQVQAQHAAKLRIWQDKIDAKNEELKVFAQQEKELRASIATKEAKIKERKERRQKIANLRRFLNESYSPDAEREGVSAEAIEGRTIGEDERTKNSLPLTDAEEYKEFNSAVTGLDWEYKPDLLPKQGRPTTDEQQVYLESLPSNQLLQKWTQVIEDSNEEMQQQIQDLRSKDARLEAQYRKVVSLCTGVQEDEVDDCLPSLIRAVESEKGPVGDGAGGVMGPNACPEDIGRVRDFLRKVEGSGQGALDGKHA
ncbi:transcriptional regulator swi6 [Cryomyces antarcticus]|uniref:Transcriptional regulator swi6 n=1 Tax=Cryomyces antarcticus TaxID=329879 RepID=A0ABR0KSQ7_9PEZI|nr:transcriptional regulator swi6 [Cryomyces antarcticus]